MNNPRLRHLPIGEERKTRPSATQFIFDKTEEDFPNAVEEYNIWVRRTLGDDWVFNATQVNPTRIIEHVSEHPYYAALMCQNACHILASGHHARVHDYMISAYVIALSLKKNNLHAGFIASKLKDGRSTSIGISTERFEVDILHYLFVFIFAQSKLVKRNRAWQWADSLQAFFDDDRDPAEVERLLKSYGQNKLRLAALDAKSERTAQRRDKAGSGSLSEHIDAILAERGADDIADAPPQASVEDEITDFGPRGVPPPEYDQDDDSALDMPNGEGEGNEEPEETNASTVDELDGARSIDGEVVMERLHTVLVGMMNVSAQLAEPNLGAIQQKRLLPLMMLLSNEIVDLQRMLRGH